MAVRKHTFAQYGGGTTDPNAFKCNGGGVREEEECVKVKKKKKKGSVRKLQRKKNQERPNIKQQAENSELEAQSFVFIPDGIYWEAAS